jgi:hypothetical protein
MMKLLRLLQNLLYMNRLGTASPPNGGTNGGFLNGGRTCGEPYGGFARASIY